MNLKFFNIRLMIVLKLLILKRVLKLSLLQLVSVFFVFVLLVTLIFVLELDEEGFRIALTIVDTPGFGDNINNESKLVYF